MGCVTYNCDEITEHLKNDCEEFLQGGIPQVILLECNHTVTDPSNASQITANIAAGTATLIQNVKIGVDAASPVEIDSPISCQPPKLVNYDRSASYMDANVNSNNITLYDTCFSGRSFGGMIVYECGADQVTWYDSVLNMTGSRIIPNNDLEFQRFEGTVKWKSKTEGQIYAAPAGIFV